MTQTPAPTGPAVIQNYLRNLDSSPGVYRMLDAQGAVLYVGKARDLKARVSSYARPTGHSGRIARMIRETTSMMFLTTRTETEALLLEQNLIKQLKPRYNVLLRDDKSYPFVLLTKEAWPRIAFHRGPRAIPGRYFGPYPSAVSVRDTLNLMHKLFRLRSCEDSVFRNRSRPCLQYQIGRCSAPCVGFVEPDDYAESIRRATLFLDGRSEELGDELTRAMQQASEALEFEQAARLRDMIATIRKLQARQTMDGRNADLDVLAVAMQGANACVLLLAFRDGRNLGTRAFFPKTNGEDSAAEVLAAFVSQYYGEQPPPLEIVLDRDIPERELIEEALSENAGRKIALRPNVRGERAAHLELVRRNAELALATELTSSSAQQARVQALQELLAMPEPPARIECFDISHTMGEATVASCVVFDGEGAVRSQYRRYNIAGIEPGDDYAAMQQALERRFRRAAEEGGVLPDLLLIDGGETLARQTGLLDARRRPLGWGTRRARAGGNERRGQRPGRPEAGRDARIGHRGRRRPHRGGPPGLAGRRSARGGADRAGAGLAGSRRAAGRDRRFRGRSGRRSGLHPDLHRLGRCRAPAAACRTPRS